MTARFAASLLALATLAAAAAFCLSTPAPTRPAVASHHTIRPAPAVNVPQGCFRLEDGRTWCPAGDPGSTDGTPTPTS